MCLKKGTNADMRDPLRAYDERRRNAIGPVAISYADSPITPTNNKASVLSQDLRSSMAIDSIP
jgi:hypothetical protein